jgi:hypothetical protein
MADQLQSLNVAQESGTNTGKQGTSKVTMRVSIRGVCRQIEYECLSFQCDAPPFSPSSGTKNTSTNESETQSAADKAEIKPKTEFIYDLKKYKHDYFLSELSCSFDRDHGKFGAPTGICALPDDRLLVANFDRDSVLLVDIKGVVHQIFKDLPTPKAVIQTSSGSAVQAVIATRKEAIILDIATGKIVVRSKMRGFYPWNIQYIHDQDIYAGKMRFYRFYEV